MNRSGIFQIAFDRDRYGPKSVKQEPGPSVTDAEESTDRSITEQRLQIDHPDFFCGHGDKPPVGIDNCRPKGAWYLHYVHERAAVRPVSEQEQQQPVSEPVSPPPVACDRTPHNFINGGGGQSSISSSPAFPQSHVACGSVPHGGGNSGDLGSSSAVAAAAQATADATGSVQ